MHELFLDLRDRRALIDFLAEYSPWADPAERELVEHVVKDYEAHQKIPTSSLVEATRRLAKHVWPVRQAFGRWIREGEGAQEEWKNVVSAIRASTAHVLQGSAKGISSKNLSEVLMHTDVVRALTPEDHAEIREVQRQVHYGLWKKHRESLAPAALDAKRKLATYVDRLGELRELAVSMPEPFQSELFTKLEQYEDRLLFAGEALPLEVLEDEVRYYRDQKEISPI